MFAFKPDPNPLHNAVTLLLLALRALWQLGPQVVLGLMLVAFLLLLADLGGVLSAWVWLFGVLAIGMLVLFSFFSEPWLRVLGSIVTVGGSLAVAAGVYWRAATPTTMQTVLTALGGVAFALLQIALVFLPNILERWQGIPVRRAQVFDEWQDELAHARDLGARVLLLRLPIVSFFGWTGAVIVPIVATWLLTSVVHDVVDTVRGWPFLGLSTLAPTETARAAERQRRTALAAATGKTVAVTLSGGGYRAALTHAGLLGMLDRAGIPVSVLSTVSGGSIVGAAYSQGWTPDCFAHQLRRRTPGLPDDLLAFPAIVGNMILPRWGSGDVYADHFRRRYFHAVTLAGTGPPELVVNVTDYSTGARLGVFRSGLLPSLAGGERQGATHPADTVALARLVAASGAFPVAFEPVTIHGIRYVDGGVIENLGVTGLAQYVTSTGRVPDVLIVSDLSAEPRLPRGSFKPSLFQMAVQAPDLTSRALHQVLYRDYSGGAYHRDGKSAQPFLIDRRTIWPTASAGRTPVFILAPTSPGERHRFAPGAEQQRVDRVASLPTLQELSPEEVDGAFWTGAKLTREYLPKICDAIGRKDCVLPEVPAEPAGCPREP